MTVIANRMLKNPSSPSAGGSFRGVRQPTDDEESRPDQIGVSSARFLLSLPRKSRHSRESGNPPGVGPRLRGDDSVCDFHLYGWTAGPWTLGMTTFTKVFQHPAKLAGLAQRGRGLRILLWAAVLLLLWPEPFVMQAQAPGGYFIPGDAKAGIQIFFQKGCAKCHAVLGEGGRAAPDLARTPPGQPRRGNSGSAFQTRVGGRVPGHPVHPWSAPSKGRQTGWPFLSR